MDNEPTNPLDIPLIVDLICDLLNPPALLNCREVNHCWNDIATRQLLAKGWTVNLTTSRRMQEYWKLMRAVEKENGGKGLAPAPVNLHMSHLSTGAGPASKSEAEKIPTEHKVGFRHGVKSISARMASSGIHPKLWSFLQHPTTSTTLIEIGFDLWESLPPPDPQQQLEAAADDDDKKTQPDPDLKLSQLKVLASDFTAPPRPIQLGRAQIESLKTLLAAAPNLESIRCIRRGGLSRQDASPFFLLQRHDLNSTAELTWAENLMELDLVLQEMFHVPHLRLRLNTFRKLRILKISTPDLGEGAPSQISIEFRQLGLLQLIRENCPALESLEITEINDCPGPRFQQVPPDNQDELDRLRLTQIIHYGYRIKKFLNTGETPEVSFVSARCFLFTMNRLPFLRSVVTNMEACIALTRVYGGRRVEPGVRFPTWAGVVKLVIDVSHASLPPISYGWLRLQNVVIVIKAMFPNLEDLIINLGGDRVGWKVTSDLGYVLQIVFGLKSLRRAEINNYYNGWTLPEMSRISSSVEENVDEGQPAAAAPRLETLAIHEITPSFTNYYVDTTAFPSPRLDLFRLQELIPPAVRPGLTLEIDGELLWNSGLHSSYAELIQTVGSLERPRVRLM